MDIKDHVGLVDSADDEKRKIKGKLLSGEPIYYYRDEEGEITLFPDVVDYAPLLYNTYIKYDQKTKLVWRYNMAEDEEGLSGVIKTCIGKEEVEKVLDGQVTVNIGAKRIQKELKAYFDGE
ncbi:hypothetical protein NLX67_20550 [Domibacillus sp. A3M-37]|uniref:hypothetical protein n=1 Tax=Domibacillus sp. A3M-37 TaxID=2962037 RepID=UPI0020B741AF|nr:hypothetical protein [Domibacillus sp. A3M-37]MCP3764728.1 hypothetical protein [Domibacillus sp. A3M-37]